MGITLSPHAQGSEAKRFRWAPRGLKALPSLVTEKLERLLHGHQGVFPIVVPLRGGSLEGPLLPAKGENVHKGGQAIGPALVDGTWSQTVFLPNGEVAYSAGAVFDDLEEDEWLSRVKEMEKRRSEAVLAAERAIGPGEYSRLLEPEIRMRKRADGEFEAYWRVEYLTGAQDEVRFLHLNETGGLIENGIVPVPKADGKAMVFPLGPKSSEITEVPLRQLSGDGTLTNRLFRITSALNLDVRSPNLLFFFPETDRRFDLAQVYFTMENSLRWMREFLGVELAKPLEVRLHIGENGVSNAAFYHDNIIYLGSGDGVVYRDLARDPSVVTHESIHAVIDAYAGLPSEGEGGAFNEGFADFFTALILGNPRMGDNSYLQGPYRRTLENDFKAYRDFTGGVYRNGSVIAATLWDMRADLSDDKLAQLAFRTLVRLGRGARFEDFSPALAEASGFLGPAGQGAVLRRLADRGWRLP